MIRLITYTICFLIFYTSIAQSETIDLHEKINRSDAILIPGQSESRLTSGIKSNVGVHFSIDVIKRQDTRFIIDTNTICSNCLEQVIQTTNDTSSSTPGSDIAGPDDDSGDENKKDKYGALNKASNTSGDGQAFSGNAQGLNGSTVKVINGVPYVFHKEDLEAAKNDMKVSKPSTLLRQASQLSAVEMNRLADSSGNTSSARRSRSGAAVDGSGASGGFGDYESASGRKSGSAPLSSAESALKGFSKGFHGTDGMSGSGSRSLQFKNGKFKLTKGKKRKPASNNMAKAKDILNRQLQLRMNANRLEFGSANSFLFESMCQHYNNYALKHGIPNNKAPCPKN